MTSPTGPDENHPPQGGAPQGQPGWGTPQQPGYNDPQDYNRVYGQGYGGAYDPAPSHYGGPSPTDQRPGMVTAAGVIGIVWGGLGLLFGLLGLTLAFSLLGAFYGLLTLVSLVISGALLWAGLQVMKGRSPRLLLLISFVAIGINLLTMIWAAVQGGSVVGGLLGLVLPAIVVYLLLNPKSKQYYASRGITY